MRSIVRRDHFYRAIRSFWQPRSMSSLHEPFFSGSASVGQTLGFRTGGPQMSLPLSSLLFAVLWIAGMMWWNAPLATAEIVMLVVAGAIAGVLWHYFMGKYMNWMQKSRDRNASGT
jgi:hypothetical protein